MNNKIHLQNHVMNKIHLPNEIIYKILNYCYQHCHSCHKKINIINPNIIKVSNKYYFCSQECYNFI